MAMNGYAAMVKARTQGGTKRRKLDDYETPCDDGNPTRLLLDRVQFKGPIFEPAAGVGQRMVKVLREHGHKVTFGDIKTGQDFLTRSQVHKGDIITNPPYRDGLAERFSRHALRLADGKVAMLVQNGFLWGGKRAAGLFEEFVPETIIVCSDRIYFVVPNGNSGAGTPIKSQFYSHCWIVWPERSRRSKIKPGDTRTFFAGHSADSDFD